MSKTLKTVAIIAGVVALSFAIPGVGTAIGTAIGVSITAGTAATISAIASAVSMAAGTAATALQKPPDMQGTVSQVMIGANMPVPYAMGRSYIGGHMVYDKSTNGPDNYDRVQVFVYTSAGPIEEFQALQADYTTIGFSGADWNVPRVATGFYGADDGYLWLDTRKGLRPDTALTNFPGRAAFTSWGSSHKLSGFAAAAVTMEFDEDGERWASGIPQWGMIAKWVKIYDPRLDSTYPGGSGTQRWDDEATWAWSENPGLHALTYARGRFVVGKKVTGVGLDNVSIDLPAFVELANVCEANGWTIGGAVYEAPGISKWDNLKRMLAAGASEPVWIGGVLSCTVNAPKVALDTVTANDLADGPVEIMAMQSWRDRHNTIVPRYRSEAHKWEYVQADAVVNSTYLTEDGEEKTKEIQYDLVQDVDQAAELAAYDLSNGREFGPIQITVKPRLMLYRPGEALELDIPEAGLDEELAIITARTVDPANGSIQLTLMSETTAKHAFALGQVGVAPPTPTIVSSEDADVRAALLDPATAALLSSARDAARVNSYPSPSSVLSAVDAGTDATINIAAHTRVYPVQGSVDVPDVSIGAASVTGLPFSTLHYVFYDDTTLADTTPTFATTTVAATAQVGAAAGRHYVGKVTTPADGGGGTTGTGSTPPGGESII